MHYAPYVAAALFAAAILAANNAMAASSIQQSITQHSDSDSSTVITQSSSPSSSSSNSLVVSNSNISSRSVSGFGDLQIDQEMSGKIASSQINTTSGDIEAMLFGDWALDGEGFVANFTRTPTNGTGVVEYEMSGLELRSIQEINDSLVLSGTIDIASNSTELEGAPVTIMVQSGILVVGFDEDADAGELFRIPIIGFAQ